MTKNVKDNKKYEAPVIVPLGELAIGEGECSNGSAAMALCGPGGVATAACKAGGRAQAVCDTGGDPGAACKDGGGPVPP
jgi:hypothetical protein